MSRILIPISAALAITAGFAAAQEREGGKERCPPRESAEACPSGESGEACPPCKAHEPGSAADALAKAREALAAAPKAEEQLTAEQRAQLEEARNYLLKETAEGRAMGPRIEASARLLFAAAAQKDTPAGAAALLRQMGATYCAMAKALGACDEECCDECECCKGASPEALAREAQAAADKAMKLATTEERTPEQEEKVEAYVARIEEHCPRIKALMDAQDAIREAFAALAEMDIPSATGGKSLRDDLVRAALKLSGCAEREAAEEEPEEAPPARSGSS